MDPADQSMEKIMKNRKSVSPPVLPVVESDSNSSRRGPHHKPHPYNGRDMLGFVKFLALLLVGGLGVVVVQRSILPHHRRHHQMMARSNPEEKNSATRKEAAIAINKKDDDGTNRKLENSNNNHGGGGPFDAFPTLAAQLQTTELVALYVAASWCPMSTPVTQLLDDLFRDQLLQDDGSFAILYVSSDKDPASFQEYMKPGWRAVPYDSSERAALKRYFATCAKREMAELGITERDHDIPALMILAGGGSSSQSHQVLVKDALPDLRERGAAALDHWKELLRRQQRLPSSNTVNNEDVKQQ